MATLEQSTPAASQLGSTLADATSIISNFQSVVFTKYVRLVLPFDGYVFWVNAEIVSPNAGYNSAPYDTAALNASPAIAQTAPMLTIQGSLHFSIEQRQAEDETLAVNRVVFTTSAPVQRFEEPDPLVLWLATYTPPGSLTPLRFAFSATRNFYNNAGLWHYMGDAVYPALETQIIDDPAAFDSSAVVVSNSLPVWLGLPYYQKPYDDGVYPPDFPFYPSFLVPDDAVPPYASVHIDPVNTRALQSIPALDRLDNHWQLAVDRVRITFYGLRSFAALDFQDFVVQYSADLETIGIMTMPIVRDEKRTQAEIGAIAMKKTFELDVCYNQTRVRNFTLATIKSCIPSFTFPPPILSASLSA